MPRGDLGPSIRHDGQEVADEGNGRVVARGEGGVSPYGDRRAMPPTMRVPPLDQDVIDIAKVAGLEVN